MPRAQVRPASGPDDVRAAVEVWAAARAATTKAPSDRRRNRVAAKLTDTDVVALVAEGGTPPTVVGMALAERFVVEGEEVPGVGHVSMVFVAPPWWGWGVGSRLLRALQDDGGWRRLSVWTRVDNRRARRLYEARGFVDTGERFALHDDETIARYEWRAR